MEEDEDLSDIEHSDDEFDDVASHSESVNSGLSPRPRDIAGFGYENYNEHVGENQKELSTAEINSFNDDFNQYELIPKTFIEQLKEKLGATETASPTSANSWKLTYSESSNPTILQNREIHRKLKLKYSILSDYIDAVHDLKKCTKFLLDIIEKYVIVQNSQFFKNAEEKDEAKKYLSNLRNKLCGSAGEGLINVPASHDLHKQTMSEYINDIRDQLGITISNFDDPFEVNSETFTNLCNYLIGSKVARESGRLIIKFAERWAGLDFARSIVNVPHNLIGEIDGCEGECEITDPNSPTTSLTWECKINGIINAKVISSKDRGNLVSTVYVWFFDDKSIAFKFTVSGQIVLDDVVALLPPGEAVFRGEDRDSQSIEFNGVFNIISNTETIVQLTNTLSSKQYAATIALKTMCDKRLFQRMTTDCAAVGTRIVAFSTTDWYVIFGHLLAYLNGEIPYFPDIFYSGGISNGFLVYRFGDGGSNELLKKYAYYRRYVDFLHSGPNLFSQMKYTDETIAFSERMIDDRDERYTNFWEYIKHQMIANQREKWETIKSDLKTKLSTVTTILSAQPIDKNALLTALTFIPTTIPNLSDFFLQITQQEDVTGLFSKKERTTRQQLMDAFINALDKSLSEEEAHAQQRALANDTSDLISSRTGFESEFLERAKNKVGINSKRLTSALRTQTSRAAPLKSPDFYDGKNIRLFGININEEITSSISTEKTTFLEVGYNNDDHLSILSQFLKEYNENVDDEQKIYSYAEGRLVFLKIPLTIELLINLIFNFPKTSTKRVLSNPVIEKCIELLFFMTKDLLKMKDDDKGKFTELMLEEIKQSHDNNFGIRFGELFSSYPEPTQSEEDVEQMEGSEETEGDNALLKKRKKTINNGNNDKLEIEEFTGGTNRKNKTKLNKKFKLNKTKKRNKKRKTRKVKKAKKQIRKTYRKK